MLCHARGHIGTVGALPACLPLDNGEQILSELITEFVFEAPPGVIYTPGFADLPYADIFRTLASTEVLESLRTSHKTTADSKNLWS